MAAGAQRREANFSVPSHEAPRYNLSSCPPKKRFRAEQDHEEAALPLADATNMFRLPAKKRVHAIPPEQHPPPPKKNDDEPTSCCSFCHTSGDSECAGVLMSLQPDGTLAPPQTNAKQGNCINVHTMCAEWAPNVYFSSESRVENLKSEVKRAEKLRCSSCGIKGAALGCFSQRCRRSYHYACAQSIPACSWDLAGFLLFCPQHASSCAFPSTQ